MTIFESLLCSLCGRVNTKYQFTTSYIRHAMTIIIDKEHPKNIYLVVANEVAKLLGKLSGSSNNDKVSQATDVARATLEKIKSDVEQRMNELERDAEWNTFSIAFYGETNVGKSTVIETLRILLREQSKVEAQHKFKEIQSKDFLTDAHFETLKQSILPSQKMLDDFQKNLTNIDNHSNYSRHGGIVRHDLNKMDLI